MPSADWPLLLSLALSLSFPVSRYPPPPPPPPSSPSCHPEQRWDDGSIPKRPDESSSSSGSSGDGGSTSKRHSGQHGRIESEEAHRTLPLPPQPLTGRRTGPLLESVTFSTQPTKPSRFWETYRQRYRGAEAESERHVSPLVVSYFVGEYILSGCPLSSPTTTPLHPSFTTGSSSVTFLLTHFLCGELSVRGCISEEERAW